MNGAPFKNSWELNRQSAMKDVTVMTQTARMYFHSFDLSDSVPAGERVRFPVSSSSSPSWVRSLLWRRW